VLIRSPKLLFSLTLHPNPYSTRSPVSGFSTLSLSFPPPTVCFFFFFFYLSKLSKKDYRKWLDFFSVVPCPSPTTLACEIVTYFPLPFFLTIGSSPNCYPPFPLFALWEGRPCPSVPVLYPQTLAFNSFSDALRSCRLLPCSFNALDFFP